MIYIVSAENQELVRSALANDPSTAGMFTTALTDGERISHYISCGVLDDPTVLDGLPVEVSTGEPLELIELMGLAIAYEDPTP